MKKLLVLQVLGCAITYAAGWRFGFEFWKITVFGAVPVMLAGYAWLWWFRNVFFYRDPERCIPQGQALILSPADGRIMYLYPVSAGEVTSDKKGKKIKINELAKTDIRDAHGWLLGIYMTPFDVHFNRAPIDGEIRTLHYHRTTANLPMVDLSEYVNFTLLQKAVDMFAAPFHLENERMTMQIQNGKVVCFLILIADRFINKITRFFQEAQQIKKGDKISFIERGSQTDLFIACEHISFRVQPGEQVYAGQTIIATLER
jgi:phosphatidylserine decarboxylase